MATFHGLALSAATKTMPEGTCARRRGARRDKINGRSSFLLFLCALGGLCAEIILATMRDSDGLQCKERIDKNLNCLFSL
jgi:hypothetical protein